MNKHTPGPWHIYSEHHPLDMDGYAPYTIYNVHDKENNHVCRVFNPQQMPDEANARLIAAAPELLTMVGRLGFVLSEVADNLNLDLDGTYIQVKSTQGTGAQMSLSELFEQATTLVKKIQGEENE